jgi:hypothetical protein
MNTPELLGQYLTISSYVNNHTAEFKVYLHAVAQGAADDGNIATLKPAARALVWNVLSSILTSGGAMAVKRNGFVCASVFQELER